MSKFLRFGIPALFLLALSFSQAHAIRLTLAPSNDVNGGGVIGVPSFSDLMPGEEFDVYVWLAHENDSFVNGYSLDLFATTPGVVEAVSSEILNLDVVTRIVGVGDLFPTPRFPAPAPPAADDRVVRMPQLNTNGALVWNGALGKPTGRGIDSVNGIVVTTNGVVDTGYDATNDTFLVQSVRLRVLPDAGGKSTGLQMRVGQLGFGIDNALPNDPQFVFFGDGTTGSAAGTAGATDGGIHAMITVFGDEPVVGVTRTSHDGSDTSGDVVFDSVRNTFMDAGGATSGRINILNFLGDGSGDLPLFFDLVEGANAQQLVDDLNAAANGEYTAALSSFSAPNAGGGSSTADIEVRYAGVPAGGNFFVDFNFGDVGVAAVGVPEPSSLALVGMGLIGLVGYGIRRRRSA